MPLKKGESDAVISENISTVYHEGISDGLPKKRALRRAIAIALHKAGVGRKRRRKRRRHR